MIILNLMNSYSIILLLAAFTAFLFAYIVFQRRAVPGAKPLMLLILAVGVWSGAYAFELNSKNLAEILFWARIVYIGIVLAPAAWLAFTLEYSGQGQWLTRRNMSLLAIVPVVVIALVWSNELHHLFWKEMSLVEYGSITLGIYTYGGVFWFFTIYSYILILVGSYFIIRSIYRGRNFFRWQGILLLIGTLVPWCANAVYRLDLYPSLLLDPTPLAFVISALAYTLALMKYGLLDIIPVARAALISEMEDGLIVLDTQDRIVDLNPAAENIFNLRASSVIGQEIECADWGNSNILAALNGNSNHSTEIVIGSSADMRFYDLRASSLKDRSGSKTGRMIVLRDITERVKTYETLDHRGAILETVSFAATRFLASSSWEETIQELLERLGESAQASRVYIFEIITGEEGGALTRLRHEWTAPGIPSRLDNPALQSLSLRKNGFARWEDVLRNNQPVYGVVDELPENEQKVLHGQKVQSIAAVPIFVGTKWWGAIGFEDHTSRREWTKEEIEALQAAAGAIGSSIQRKQAEEILRQRATELATLHEVSLEITSPYKLPTLLQMIVERAVALLGGTGGGLYLCDPEKQEVECVTSANTTSDFTEVKLKYGEGAAGIVAQTGKPIVIGDYRVWQGRAQVYEKEQPFRSVLSAPMMWQGEVLGVIHILHDSEVNRFDEADLTLLTLFANQAAVALHNANLYEIAQQRARQAALLNEITQMTISAPDLNSMLQGLAERLREMFGADSAYITFWDEDNQAAVPMAAYGDLNEVYPSIPPVTSEVTMTSSVLNSGHVLVEEDLYHSEYISPHIAAMFPAQSMIGLPLIADGRKLGAALISYNRPQKFTSEDIALGEEVSAQIALAVSKIRLLEVERRRVDELEALRATVADISTELDLDTLLRAILERATTLLNGTGGELGLYDEAKNEIDIVVSHNMGKDYTGIQLDWGEGAIGRAIETNLPVAVSDYQHWEGRSTKYDETPYNAALAVPLQIRGRIAGALKIVESSSSRTFSPEDQRLLYLFAQQAANAIENARLYANEKQRAGELEILFESSAAMVKTLELPKVYRIAIERLGKAVNSTSAHLLTCNLESGIVTVLAEYFSPQANQWESKSDLGASYNLNDFPQTLAALRSGKPLKILISDPLVDPNDRIELSDYHVKSSLNLPMIVSDNVLGYAEIWDSLKERVWSEDEVRLCQTLANQAAIVIENARLYNEMQHMAVTDVLTGAYNRRGLFEVGQREINRARRVSRPLSAIMLDIDFFKQINDLHSHAVGDQILQGLANLCQENLRDIDIFGRYGGDEFAILLPETDVNSANYVAQRLRRRVSETPFVTQNSPISISISLGIACTIGEITDLAVLLDCADSAMYEAKRAGRNQVCVA